MSNIFVEFLGPWFICNFHDQLEYTPDERHGKRERKCESVCERVRETERERD